MFRYPINDKLDVNDALTQMNWIRHNSEKIVPANKSCSSNYFIRVANALMNRAMMFCHQYEMTNTIVVAVHPLEKRAYDIRKANLERLGAVFVRATQPYNLEKFTFLVTELYNALVQEHLAVTGLNTVWYPFVCDQKVWTDPKPVHAVWSYDLDHERYTTYERSDADAWFEQFFSDSPLEEYFADSPYDYISYEQYITDTAYEKRVSGALYKNYVSSEHTAHEQYLTDTPYADNHFVQYDPEREFYACYNNNGFSYLG